MSGKMTLSVVNRSLSAAILLQITSGDRKWARNGDYEASSLFGHFFYKPFCVGFALTYYNQEASLNTFYPFNGQRNRS